MHGQAMAEGDDEVTERSCVRYNQKDNRSEEGKNPLRKSRDRSLWHFLP